MDKDNRDDFTFAKLSDLKLPLTFRMYAQSLACPVQITYARQMPDTAHN